MKYGSIQCDTSLIATGKKLAIDKEKDFRDMFSELMQIGIEEYQRRTTATATTQSKNYLQTN